MSLGEIRGARSDMDAEYLERPFLGWSSIAHPGDPESMVEHRQASLANPRKPLLVAQLEVVRRFGEIDDC
jgi:hypothetical protein